MSAGSFSEFPQVQKVLENCRRQILQHTCLVGVATVLAATVGYMLSVSVLDYFIGLPGFVRAIVLVAFVAGAAFTIWRFLVVPLRATTPAQQLGAAIDLKCPQLQESLSTLISIQAPEASDAESGSVVMQQQIQVQVAEQLRRLGPQQFVNSDLMKKRCGLAAVVLLAASIPLLLWPSASALSMKRFVQPFANLATVSNLFFDVGDGTRTVARWSNVVFKATPMWRNGTAGERPEEVMIRLVATNGQSENIAMAFDEVDGCYTYQLSRIVDPVGYQISGGGTTSELFRVSVVDAPAVDVSMMTSTPPDYTGLPVQRFDGLAEVMKVFEGSQLAIHLEFNKPVKSAELVWTRRDERPLTEVELFDIQFDNLTGEEVPMMDLEAPSMPEPEPLIMQSSAELSEDRLSASLNLTADVGGDFEFVVIDEFDLRNLNESERTMKVTFDEAPVLKVNGVTNDDQYRATDILPVNCFVTDDIGIGSVDLQYSVNAATAVVVPATDFSAGQKEHTHKFRLPLEDLELVDGDWLTIRVRATDERPTPGPHEVWSEEIAIEIDKNAKPPSARALEQQTQEMIDALKQLERQLAKDKTRAEELQLAARREWNAADHEQVRRLSEKEQQQGRILEQLANEVATHPMMKAEAAALQELVPEVREQLPELLEKAADESRNLAARSLLEAVNNIENIRRQLQLQIKVIEQRAKLEQDLAELNRLALDAEKLSTDANQLESDKQNPDNKPQEASDEEWKNQLNARQRELTEERDELTEDIERLLNEERELLLAAQRAQTERFDSLKQTAAALAQKQNELNQSMEAMDRSNKENETQLAAKQQDLQTSQQEVAKQTSELPPELSDLVERMQLEALQMQQQAQQASSAEMLAQQAQQNAEQALAQLEQGELKKSGESGRQAVNQLNQIANGQQAVDQSSKEPDALVPNEVGESVADALQKLQQAAKAMQEESGQQSETEAGQSAEQGNNAQQSQSNEGNQSASSDGESGDGQASSESQQQGQPSASQQQLDSAAKSLAQAAKDALPGQFDPGQPPDGENSEQSGRDAMGNPALWDGRIPDDVRQQIAGSRDWGKISDELDTETSNSVQASQDSEYRSLIRRYFKELAKASATDADR